MLCRIRTAVEHNLLSLAGSRVDDDRRNKVRRQITYLLAGEGQHRIDQHIIRRGQCELMLHIIINRDLVVREERVRHRHQKGKIRRLYRLEE